MTTNSPRATVYLESANYKTLIEYADSKGISLKHKGGKAIVSSSLLNLVLSELLVSKDKKCDTSTPPNDTLTELQNRVSALEAFQQKIEALEGEDGNDFSGAGTEPLAYDSIFTELEAALKNELKLGSQSPTVKKIRSVMDRFRRKYL